MGLINLPQHTTIKSVEIGKPMREFYIEPSVFEIPVPQPAIMPGPSKAPASPAPIEKPEEELVPA